MSGGFRFKQFAVEQERSAMKVGTDGVLLGAWAALDQGHRRVLDVGTGTGLIALMAAQRTAEWGAKIVGVEIERESYLDAQANCAASPWADRISLFCGPIQEFEAEEPFDHILSNPPYFVNSLTSPNQARTTARHTTSLSFEQLASDAERLLAPEGVLSVVLPTDAVADMTLAAARRGLFLRRRLDVSSKRGGRPLRALLTYGRKALPTEVEHLTIHEPDGSYTEPYRLLTRDFYLKF
ncbi:MAG: methyltransferase [Tidjanibacter sp.]|nr:methyltransferase [Tidjanibacter sp.]